MDKCFYCEKDKKLTYNEIQVCGLCFVEIQLDKDIFIKNFLLKQRSKKIKNILNGN
jgi:hypothetical protein